MSFTFNWPRFSDQFHYDAIQMLNTALNKGNKPPIIADRIEVVELEMGTQPPELEIRDIGDLTVDQFRGIFRLTYAGDAHLVLKTKVQANPLNHKQPDVHLMGAARGMLAAKHPLVVPMLLRLSHFKLSSYVVLVVSKQKGITLVFKTDPLQAVDINSTFDSIAVIQNFIQHEIEGQLRQMFREDLPGIIHRLSQQWVKAKVEAPYLNKYPTAPPTPTAQRPFDTMSTPPGRPSLARKTSQSSLATRRPRIPSAASVAGSSRSHRFAPHTPSPLSPPPPPIEAPTATHPALENFDPTYGLRPEGLPTQSVFRGFGSLFVPNKGLADLAEEAAEAAAALDDDARSYDEYDDGESEFDEGASFDFVDWDRTSHAPSSGEATPEYETIPAVGGGTITRPRIYHAQSAGGLGLGTLSRSHSQTVLQAASPSSASTAYFSDYGSTLYGTRARAHTPDSADSPPSLGSSSAPSRRTVSTALTEHTFASAPAAGARAPPLAQPPLRAASSSALYTRRASVSSSAVLPTSPSAPAHLALGDAGPVPGLDTPTLRQLSTLSTSNHTLSPYTRGLAHFTVRSVPPRGAAAPGARAGAKGTGTPGAGGERPKARRKRMYRLGGKGAQAPPPPDAAPAAVGEEEAGDYFAPRGPAQARGAASPTPPSEFDVSDMDRYFPPHDAAARAHARPRPGPGHTQSVGAPQPSPGLSPSLSRLRRPATGRPMSS